MVNGGTGPEALRRAKRAQITLPKIRLDMGSSFDDERDRD